MNILLVIHHHLDPNAGASGVTLQLGKAYEELGHDICYYSYDDIPLGLSGKLAGVLFPYYVARHIRKVSKKVGLDVVHASSGDAWLWGILFGRLGWRPKPLLVTQSHGLEHTMHEQILEEARNGRLKLSWKYPLYNGSLMLWKVAKSFQLSDFCFMLNSYDAQVARKKIGVAAEKVKIFPNGIPDEFIGLPFVEFQGGQGRLPGIAFVGSYLDRKGIQYGVPALNNLMQRYPQLRVSFLGTGGTPESVLCDFSVEVRNRVTVVPSFDKPELPRLLKDCHILLFPSLSEGFPLALPEAMACGLAPIVTQIPGSTEVVVDKLNGLVVQPRNQLQLEEAIEQLINDGAFLQQLRCQAYQTVQTYSWRNIAQQHLALYTSSLEPSQRSTIRENSITM
jgi:glycosyltransferase involved in cell wall biosynthesis